jgi:indole-3-glycerol phosphate synthase/phosphoribosylanthranilate isomerase
MTPVEKLLQLKRSDVEKRKRLPGLVETFQQFAAENRLVHWGRHEFRLIAEVKRASLSAGVIRSEIDPASLAASYERAGASAISVLTEENFFHGSLNDLRDVKKAVSLPLLQKDFVIDGFQIREAKFYGASFILLIAKFLTQKEMDTFLHLCGELQMNALVEVTDERDLEKVMLPVTYLGVNSRNLETLHVDKKIFGTLRKKLPDAFLIAESGMNSLEDLEEVIDLGYNGVLIGEHFLRSENPAAELSKFARFAGVLREVPIRSKPKVKICGITSEEDAILSIDAGASALGFVFAESPRQVNPSRLRAFRSRIPWDVLCVGVFRGQPKETVEEIIQDFGLDIAQVYDPIQLKSPVWNARVARIRSDVGQIRSVQHSDSVLWDVKANEDQTPELWHEIARGRVFALAGGLTPENVHLAVSICHPEWVDVARGVEKEPGIKDGNKIRNFIKEATK